MCEGNDKEPSYIAAVQVRCTLHAVVGAGRSHLHRLVRQMTRLRLALAKQHITMLQYIPKLADEGFVFLYDFYDCPQPELEALLTKIGMKTPHVKLVRSMLTAKPRPHRPDFAALITRPELPPTELLLACSLSKYADQVKSQGYDSVQLLLDATETELAAEVLRPMKPVEQRRFLQVIGITFEGLVETAEQVTPAAQLPPKQVSSTPSHIQSFAAFSNQVICLSAIAVSVICVGPQCGGRRGKLVAVRISSPPPIMDGRH